MKVLLTSFPRAAVAALFVCACATEDTALHQEVASLRTDVRTLQQENAEMLRTLNALSARVDLLAARPQAPPVPASATAAVAPAPPTEPLVPSRLKVVRLRPEPKAAKASASPGTQGRDEAARGRGSPPPVPTDTPIRDPDPETLRALGAGGPNLAAEAQAALDAARALSGLPRSRALEQFAGHYPNHHGAQEALVDAARTRDKVGDPDGSCEDYARAVREYPVGEAMPTALAGLASCERRAGRDDEARRLEARLAEDYPNSAASRHARERTSAAQGAVP